MYYYVVVGIMVALYVTLTLSVNIITGYAGQPTLGHAAFLGVGAYTAAMLMTKAQVSWWLTFPAAFATAALVGLIVGAASLRVRDDFLAITTMGVGFVVVAVFQYVPWFGGAMGVGGLVPPPGVDKYVLLGLTIALAVLTGLISWHLERSWAGMALRSVRDDEAAAEAMGADIRRFKLLAFVTGCGLAGLAGPLYAVHLGFVAGPDFAFHFSMTVLTMAVFGGLGTIRGAVAGAIILGVAPELFRFISDYRNLVYGALLIFMMLFRPTGLLGVTRLKLPRLLGKKGGA
ncbi:MAG TPA: branched-chain amino acid ABC transporter permease [Symbiobacteriaceae bacterium]|nr:branched-chain amino acid ABC transporter permease [Symbiobacteriaceae bacterium]